MIVVDTDVLIWILRGQANYKRKFENVVQNSQGNVYITPIQVAEIMAGVRQSERKKVETFLESLSIIPIDRDIGKMAGDFIQQYGKSHQVTLADACIAAATRTNSFRLWTINKKHYPMMDREQFLIEEDA
jgi:predicted nucleic acid-binding protein